MFTKNKKSFIHSGGKILASSLILMGLSACGEFEKEKIVTVEPKARNFALGDAQFNLSETDIPHQYQMAVSWPNDIKKVYVEKEGKKVYETDSGQPVTLQLKDNTKYNIRVFSTEAEKPVLLGEAQGSTPVDYTFNGVTDLKEDLTVEANRVFFLSKSKIQTNGHILNVKAQTVVSDEAEIFSFPEGAKATTEKDGLSGGLVQIVSEFAHGNMKVTLRGQNGGDGLDGLPWSYRAPDAGQGSSGAHDCVKVSVGGIGIGGALKCWCTSNPNNGFDGPQGAVGRNGTPAGRGGNTGKIVIEVKETSDFAVEPNLIIGLAGTSGKGGPGQEGGNGGPPGDPTSSECHSASPGNKGPQGNPGENAAPSQDGGTEIMCISIGQGSGKCKI